VFACTNSVIAVESSVISDLLKLQAVRGVTDVIVSIDPLQIFDCNSRSDSKFIPVRMFEPSPSSLFIPSWRFH
jgi:hypothetical protein